MFNIQHSVAGRRELFNAAVQHLSHAGVVKNCKYSEVFMVPIKVKSLQQTAVIHAEVLVLLCQIF